MQHASEASTAPGTQSRVLPLRQYGGSVAGQYLRYLQAEGVLDKALDNELSSIATRAQMAHILANILPEETLPSIHTDLITQAYASRRIF